VNNNSNLSGLQQQGCRGRTGCKACGEQSRQCRQRVELELRAEQWGLHCSRVAQPSVPLWDVRWVGCAAARACLAAQWLLPGDEGRLQVPMLSCLKSWRVCLGLLS
jgi:hypothetical protein